MADLLHYPLGEKQKLVLPLLSPLPLDVLSVPLTSETGVLVYMFSTLRKSSGLRGQRQQEWTSVLCGFPTFPHGIPVDWGSSLPDRLPWELWALT